MGSGGQAAANDPLGGFSSFIPLILMFAVFYFLLIRPQQKKAKEHREMLGGLKRGDDVITAGGLLGRIVEVNDDILTLDLGETKVRVTRSAVTGVPSVQKAAERKSKKDAKKDEATSDDEK